MCVFCDIANKKIPSYVIYENDDVLSFLDISQATFGHTLVVPKKHIDNIFSMDEKTLSSVGNAVIKTTKILKEKLNGLADNMNIINNAGEKAGQTVMHFHIHLIPRYDNDNVKLDIPVHDFNKEKLEEVWNKITK